MQRLVVHHGRQLLGSFIVLPDGTQVGDVDLYVVGLQHEVAPESHEGSLLG